MAEDSDPKNPFGPWPYIQVPPILAEDSLKLRRARLAFDYNLTHREVDLVEWLTIDATVGELAEFLNEDQSQLEERISLLRKKLGVKRRVGIIGIAAEYALMGTKTLLPNRKTP